MSLTAQKHQIRRALEAGERLTPMDALKRFRCFRLSARIYDLRQEGLAIEKELIAVGDSVVAEYRMQQ